MKSDRLRKLSEKKCRLLDDARKIFEEISEMANPNDIEYSGDIEPLNRVMLKNIYPLYRLQIEIFKVEEAYIEECGKIKPEPKI